MLDKLKALLPGVGSVIGFLGFGKIQGIMMGVVAAVVFIAGMNVGHKLGFKEGFYEGKKAAAPEETDRRRIWPFREDPDVTEPVVLESAIPVP